MGRGPWCAHLPLPIPPALTPQPTHPRTLQSLEGDRSRERKLEDQAEPCPLACPSPTLPHPTPFRSPPTAHLLTKSPRLPLSPFGPCHKARPTEGGVGGEGPFPRWGNRGSGWPRFSGTALPCSASGQPPACTWRPEGPRIPRGPMMPSFP